MTGGIRCRCTSQVRACSARKPSLVLLAEPLPELGGHRAEPVDGGAPVAGLLDRVVDVGVDRRVQLVEGAEPGDAGRGRHGRGRRQAVHPGHEVVPRDRVQRAAGAVRGDGDVDHGQAGADEQQVAVGQLLRSTGRRPAAASVARPAGRPVGAGSGAGGEDDGAGDDRLAGREADHEPVAAAVDAEDGLLPALEPGVAGVLRGGRQQAGHVVAVHPPRHEVLRLRLGVVVGADPAEEVLGVAREGAHPARGHVEQVPVVGRWSTPGRGPSWGRGPPARPGSARTGPVTRWEAVSAPAAPAPTTTTQQSPSPPRIATLLKSSN